MTEKVLLEFQACQREGRYRYKMKCCKRVFTLREPEGVTSGLGKNAKMNPNTRRNILQVLEALENLHDEIYPPGNMHELDT